MILPNPSRPYRAWRLPRTAGLPLLALALAGLLSACGKDAPKPGAAAPEVTVLTLRSQPLALQQELPGRSVASQESDVRPQVDGVLVRRLFEQGQWVKAGQPLFQIEPALYQAALNEAQANLKTAEAAAVTARLRAQRMQALGKDQLAARQDVDDAIASDQQAAAAAQAAQAARDTASTRLGFATVTSPIAGCIGRALFTPGALVTSGQADPLARVQQMDPMNVDITQSSNEYLALRRAIADGGVQADTAPVRLRLSDGTDYPLPGTLEFADVDVQQETGSITLRARFPNPDGQLLPGMYVRALVGQGTRQQALLVPQAAVDRSPKGEAQAWLVDKDGKARLRLFRTARAVGDQWLVLDGLAAGEQVVVAGAQGLADGMTVRVKPAPAPAGKD
ncbi:efflux RND transporter periplasmic adaptor subunit [Stenotrophomonas maltophilia]|uniref:efflux RND transporter periplasmic adaptor subunit n=1 Tax=Stenotrophomonas maltophilia TaxID=40324 RepID=UPI000C2611BA|nr:efflux RND transporter periplasmic adaptor subunit [Stenotrophomonas maltophilia]PJL06200.1 efflux transporter periplasmic adaptor subunit [Stenotrophomonas maltophilia]